MTIAEKVRQKLSNIDKELESIYETSDAIKSLEVAIQGLQKKTEDTFSNQVAGMNSLYNTAEQNNKQLLDEYQTVLGSCEKDINVLKKSYVEELESLQKQKKFLDLSIQALEQRKQKLDETIESALTVYADEQKNINAALTLLGITNLDISALEDKLTQAFSGLDSAISNKLSKYINALDSKLEPRINMYLSKLDSEIANFKKEIDTKIDKKLNYQNEQFDGWVKTKEAWLQSQQEKSKRLIAQIESSETSHTLKVNELTQQANGDLKDFKENTLLQVQGVQKEIVTKIDKKLQALSDIENRITGFINNSMRNATNQLNADINERLNQLEQSQTQFLQHQRALVDQLIQRQNLIEQSTPGFRDNLSQLSDNINALKDQEIQSILVRIDALEEKTKTKSSWFRK